jgi:dienelactone hydrolase
MPPLIPVTPLKTEFLYLHKKGIYMELQFEDEVVIPSGKVELKGDLIVPVDAKAIVIFSHGSGSSRKSPRNKMVAQYLNKRHIATLLFDLLTVEEDLNYENRFNIPLLSDRLKDATLWIVNNPITLDCRIGYFGASTGAASALIASAGMKEIGAIVSRGGRPDLAGPSLSKVSSPTLLLIGSRDPEVIELNKYAFNLLGGEKKMEIIPGATHLFEEPGTLEKVCELAYDWFDTWLIQSKP